MAKKKVTHEKSVGGIIFSKEDSEPQYLLLHYPSSRGKEYKGHWDYVKGHIEAGENEKETLLREAKEEANLDKDNLEFKNHFKEKIEYWFRKQGTLVHKIVDFYLLKSKTKKVKLSFEHDDFKWLPYKKAKQTLTFKNAKQVLKKANDYLTK